jgi:hypothetical protein
VHEGKEETKTESARRKGREESEHERQEKETDRVYEGKESPN